MSERTHFMFLEFRLQLTEHTHLGDEPTIKFVICRGDVSHPGLYSYSILNPSQEQAVIFPSITDTIPL